MSNFVWLSTKSEEKKSPDSVVSMIVVPEGVVPVPEPE